MVYTHHICATEDTTSHRCACTRANSRYTCLLVCGIHIVKMRVCMRICRLPTVLYYIYVRYKFNAGGRCLSRVHAHLRIRLILSVYICPGNAERHRAEQTHKCACGRVPDSAPEDDQRTIHIVVRRIYIKGHAHAYAHERTTDEQRIRAQTITFDRCHRTGRMSYTTEIYKQIQMRMHTRTIKQQRIDTRRAITRRGATFDRCHRTKKF